MATRGAHREGGPLLARDWGREDTTGDAAYGAEYDPAWAVSLGAPAARGPSAEQAGSQADIAVPLAYYTLVDTAE